MKRAISKKLQCIRSLLDQIETLEPRKYLSVSFHDPVSLGGFGADSYVVADMNGDTKPDIVGVSPNNGIEIFINQGSGNFAAPIYLSYSFPGALDSLVVGDFNGDGVPDIAVANQSSGTIECFLGAGLNIGGANPSFLSPISSTLTGVNYIMEMQLAHFGGTSDDLVINDGANIMAVMSSGGGSFQTSPANLLTAVEVPGGVAVPVAGATFAVADFTGDGISDIAYGGGQTVTVQFGAAGGSFVTAAYPYSVPGSSQQIMAAPLASPSPLADLVCAPAGGAGDVSILLNNGGGSFGTATAYPVADTTFMGLGDFDGNGAIDVSIGEQILFNTGAGTFSQAVDVNAPPGGLAGDYTSRVGADLNADGHADLVEEGQSIQLEGTPSSGGGGGGGGGTTSGELSGSLAGSAPSSTIAGQKTKINQKLTVTNSTANTVTGNVTAALYLSSNSTIDSNSISLNSITKKVNLKAGKHLNLSLHAKSIPSSTPNGNYNLIAQITDPTGATTDVTGSAVTVAPAQIDLSGAFSKQPVAGKNGKTRLSLSLSNNGNTPAAGNLKISIDSSPTASNTGATVIASPAKKINLKNGKTQKLSLPVTLPAGTYFLVIQLDPNNTFDDVNLANNVFATSTEITVG